MLKSIRARIVFWAGVCLLLTAATITAFTTYEMRKTAIQVAEDQVATLARAQATRVGRRLEDALASARALAFAFHSVKDHELTFGLERGAGMGLIKTFLTKNPDYVGIGTAWEPNQFDQLDESFAGLEDHDNTGRFVPFWIRDASGVARLTTMPEYATQGSNAFYETPRSTGKTFVSEPRRTPDGRQVITISVPIVYEGRFTGVTRVDLDLGFLAQVLPETQLDERGRIAVLSHNGLVTASAGPDAPAAGTPHTAFQAAQGSALHTAIAAGREHRYAVRGQLSILTPIQIGDSGTPWFVHVSLPAAAITAAATTTMWINFAVGAACIALGLLILSLVAIRLSQPVRTTADYLAEIAKEGGDLTRMLEIESDDEVGELSASFNSFLATVHDIVVDVRRSAESLNIGTMQIASTGTEMSEAASTQARSLQKIAQAVTEISARAAKNSSSSQHAREASDKATSACRSGSEKMQGLRGAMGDITQSAKDISAVIQVIQGIAAQTHLLSLNASVEASRAGAAGRGFAVVAHEVRELAQRCATAVQDTSRLIEESERRAALGSGMAAEVADALAAIVDNITEVNVLIADIDGASRDQQEMITRVSQNATALDEITHLNAARSEQLATAAQENTYCMKGLLELVDKFEVNPQPLARD